MSIKSLIESAKFPIHKSGGYQVSSVDNLLIDIISQSDALEKDLREMSASEASLSAQVDSLSKDLSDSVSHVGKLKDEVSRLEAMTHVENNNSEMDSLRIRISSLEIELDEFQSAAKSVKLQALADEEHIASLEQYADEVENSISSIRAERDKIKVDAEIAIRSLQERLTVARTVPVVIKTEQVVESQEPSLDVLSVEHDLVDAPDGDLAAQNEPLDAPLTANPAPVVTSPPVRPRLMRRG